MPPGVTRQAVTTLAIQTVSVSSTVSTATATVTDRPVVTLTGDRLGNQYVAGSFDCLDSQSDPNPNCWDVLDMDEWLPVWLSQVITSALLSFTNTRLSIDRLHHVQQASNPTLHAGMARSHGQ